MFARAARSQAAKKFGTVVTVRRWVRGAPRRADVSFSTAEEMDAAISGLEGKERYGAERHRETLCQYVESGLSLATLTCSVEVNV